MESQIVDERTRSIEHAIGPLLEGEPLDLDAMSRLAAYSRYHFQRVFKDLMGEPPGEMRRRLLLEKAAWRLRHTGESATGAAFEAGFDSLEAFSRAFRKAYGTPPSRFARSGEPIWMPSPNGIHFAPLAAPAEGEPKLDLIDRILETERDVIRRILALADEHGDDVLDAQLPAAVQAMCYEEPQSDVRAALDWLLFTQEAWLCAVEKQDFPSKRDRSAAGLRARAEVALPMFAGLVRRVRDAGEWSTEFTDELCEEPTKFSFGGIIAHVATHGIVRRQAMVAALRAKGYAIGWGDPIEWEQGQASAR